MKKEIKLYNETVSIFFEERDWKNKKIHIYTDENGKRIISNTGATGIVDKSTPLIFWAIRLMGEYLIQNYNRRPINEEIIETSKKRWRDVKEEAADIGTGIHEWIEEWLTSKKSPPMPEDEKIRNGVNAFLDWFGRNEVEFIATERVVYSKKNNVVGKLDGISHDLAEEYLSMDDFKSSKGIYAEMVLQTAGYLMMIEEEIQYLLSIPFGSIKSESDKKLVKLYKKYGGFKKRRILKFGKEDGMFEVKEFIKHKEDTKGFISALNLKRRIGELEKELR